MNQEGFFEEGKDHQHGGQTINNKDNENKKRKIVAPVADETTNFLREAPIGKGLAATLKLLEERGALRSKETHHHDVVGEEKVGGSIERRDEFGRIMTPKEAFRVQCHKFHGKGFGKRKQEKRRKRYLAELQSNRLLS